MKRLLILLKGCFIVCPYQESGHSLPDLRQTQRNHQDAMFCRLLTGRTGFVQRLHNRIIGREYLMGESGRVDQPLRGRYIVRGLGVQGQDINASFLAIAEYGPGIGLAQ